AFSRSGLIICLYTSRDDLIQRLTRTDKRPLLRGGELADIVDRLLAERQSLYSKIKIRVDTTNLTPLEAARKIHDLLNTRQRILDQLQTTYIELR
ncbi:MAG TPA: shikimate kinase, partial [Candidatus Nitrosotenuis sp.]|nr:shikimate kinase [Candidatus Nitrosotenuis sp.]